MMSKNGFLLLELMIILTLAFIIIFLSAHYIIEIKNIQQDVLMRIELLSTARNVAEKMIATKDSFSVTEQDITVTIVKKEKSEQSYSVNNIVAKKKDSKHAMSVALPLYDSGVQ